MSATTLAARHATDAGAAIQMVARLTTLRTRGVLSIAELELAAEAALLSLHTSFETFVRELYLECVTGDAAIHGVRSRLRAGSIEDAQSLIAGDRPFVEWLPIEKTLERALLHLGAGQPFVRLWRRDRVMRHLDLMQVVRNRVAHSSEQALHKYQTKVAKGEAAFARPGRWLLHTPASKTNLDLIADATIAASADLSSNDRTPQQLGPAKASDGQKAAPGTYRCVVCQRVQYLRGWEELRPCPRCSTSTRCPSCGTIKRTQSSWSLEALKAVG